MSNMTEDFINLWVETLDNYTDANRPLKEAAGLFVLSSLIGHNAVIPLSTDIKPFTEAVKADLTSIGKRLNVWFLIIGRTRVSRKTTVLGLAEDYLRNVLGHDYIASTIATPEALLDEVAENKTVFGCHKAWIMDEFALILSACRSKDYMADLTDIMQKLYDGRTFSRRTRSKGKLLINNPYFTVLTSTTPYVIKSRLVTETMFIHGFLGRFMLLWDEGTANPVPLGERIRMQVDDSNVKSLMEWGSKIKNFNEVVILHLSDEARQRLNEIDEKGINVAKTINNEIITSWLGNLTEHIVKVAGLYRLSRLESLKEDVIIELEDFKRAEKFMSQVIKSVRRISEEVMKSRMYRAKELTQIDDYVELVRSIVLKKGRQEGERWVIERSTLCAAWYNKTRSACTELDKIIKAMADMGEVEVKVSATTGRPKMTYIFTF